jgi:ferrochelatase
MSSDRYDAVLLLAFGGPERMEDVRPFLENVLRGRPVPKERFDDVVHHYEVIGGRSPINEITAAQTGALSRALAARGLSIPVCFAMRNWTPYIQDVLAALGGEGGRRVLALILSAHDSEASIDRYTDAVNAALTALGSRAPSVDYVGHGRAHARIYDHPGFVRAHSEHVLSAFQSLPDALRSDAPLIFTAHSIPVSMAARGPYVQQLQATARLVAQAVGTERYQLCYQSRSGSPRDPWLDPDVNDVIRAAAAAGTKAVVLSPIGFVCDHVEVLYDLDVEAKQIAQEVGIAVARARAANDHAGFIECLADLVCAQMPSDTAQPSP